MMARFAHRRVIFCLTFFGITGLNRDSAALAPTAVAAAPSDDETPPRYEPPPYEPPPLRRPINGLIIVGAGTLAGATALAIIPAAVCDLWNHHFEGSSIDSGGLPKCDTWPLYIPVLGPWLSMGFFHTHNDSSGFTDTLLAIDGIIQAAGLAMMIGGAAARVPIAAFAKNNLRISPLSFLSGGGMLVSGRF